MLTAIVYAATQFLASHHIAAEQVTARGGLSLVAGAPSAVASRLRNADAILALFTVGISLGRPPP